jgi:hypothetical protein
MTKSLFGQHNALYLHNTMAKFDSEYEELIVKACDTLKSNGGVNIAKVARDSGVDYYALRRRCQGTGSSKSNPGAPQRLNTVQDYALLQWIHRQFKNGFPLRKRHITAAAYWLLEMDTPPGTAALPHHPSLNTGMRAG